MADVNNIYAAIQGAETYIKMSRKAADAADAKTKASWETGIGYLQCLQAAAQSKIPIPLTTGKCCANCGVDLHLAASLIAPTLKFCPCCGAAVMNGQKLKLGQLVRYNPRPSYYNHEGGVFRLTGVSYEAQLSLGEVRLTPRAIITDLQNDRFNYNVYMDEIEPLPEDYEENREIEGADPDDKHSAEADRIAEIQKNTLSILQANRKEAAT